MSQQSSKATAIQMASGSNVSANLLEAERLVAAAVGNGDGLVVLPENFAFKGRQDQDILAIRETDGEGPIQDFLSQLARRYGLWLVGGTIPLRTENRRKVRASCLIFNALGERVARYDKIHLFDVHLVETDEHYNESATIEPGDAPLVVDSPFGRLGVAVCYDLRFPELFRSLLNKGMEIVCIPASFTTFTGQAHWETLVRARAIENLCYAVAAAQGGLHVDGRETHGHSMIVDPWGKILDRLPKGTGAVSCALDLDYLRATRRNFPAIDHRHLPC